MTASNHMALTTKMNLGMLRSRGMQRVKYRSKLNIAYKSKLKRRSAFEQYRLDKSMEAAVSRGVRREIIAYLLATILTLTAGLMIYGIFF